MMNEIMSIGSVSSYVKSMSMEQKWKAKQSRGDYSSDGTKTASDWIEKNKNAVSDSNKEDNTLKNIHMKMSSGKKLTPSERQYLQKKDPQGYQRLRNIEAEQESYEQELKRCKTKEDVQKLKLAHISSALASVNSIKNNPNIPEGAKLAAILEQKAKADAIEASTKEFVESGKYAALPTEEEKRRAEKLLEEADETKHAPDEEQDREKKEGEESISPEGEVSKAEKEEQKENAPTDEARRVLRESADNDVTSEGIAKKAKAEQSYQVRKLRRSKTPYNSGSKPPFAVSDPSDKKFEARG